MLDARAVAKVDPGGMRDIIGSLPEQLGDGLRRGLGSAIDMGDAERVFIVGMGGSAIAGDVFAAWIADRSKLPIQVVRDYRLPSYAKPEDVLIAVSYSGNTEETLSATTEGIKLGCRVVAITSGGTLRSLAAKNGMAVHEVPKDLPPRGAFGYLFGILPALGEELVYGNLHGELEQAIVHLRALRDRYRPEAPVSRNRAKSLAVRLRTAIPVIYAAAPFVAIAKRWQTQLNENAKILAFASSFPEADHNELVGWGEDPRARLYRPILLRDRDEQPQMRRQLDITVDLISRRTKIEQVRDDGESLLARMLGTLYLGDYVSLYLATLRGVDPLVLRPIHELKTRLAASTRRKS